jgi:hypothetical protein
MKQKNELQLSCVKISGFYSNLQKKADGFILKCILSISPLKMHEIKRTVTAGAQTGI